MQVFPVKDVAIIIDEAEFVFTPAVKEIILDNNHVAPEPIYTPRVSCFTDFWYKLKWSCCIFLFFCVIGVVVFMIAYQKTNTTHPPPPC